MHGKGKLKYANGNEHDGDWKDDKRNGYGVYAQANVPKYTALT